MKKIITAAVSFVILSCLFFGGLKVFRYLVTDDTDSYTRIMMNQLYEPEENIDVLFVGSSHVYRSLVPEIADGIFGKFTFNAGTSSQFMDGSYAVIQAALKNNDISHVFLEMYYGVATGEEYKDRKQLTSTYIISDYIRNPLDRAAYLLNASSKEHFSNSFIVARRNWEALLDFGEISEITEEKDSDAYKNYEYIKKEGSAEYYVDRGFVANDGAIDKNKLLFSEAYGEIDLSLISEDYLNSLKDIAELCEKNDVELTLFIAPMPEITIAGKGNYDEYSGYINELSKSLNVEFYDFNYCKPNYFDAGCYDFFKDGDHLNTAGAERFTEVFSLFFTGQIFSDELFYNSLSDKLADEQERIYGIAGLEKSDDDYNQGCVVSNRKEGLEYRISVCPDEGEEYVLQDFSESRIFELPADTSGTVRIESRTAGNNSPFQIFETKY
ncbi:MAG: hypothetical protein LUC92_05505 [Clostridiales bacterium]|nr:hypothetical protein [Clostridiales bacterium]